MFSSKQTHKFDYFICYHLESGWHVTSNQGLSLGRGKSLGTRLIIYDAFENGGTWDTVKPRKEAHELLYVKALYRTSFQDERCRR